MKIKPFFMLLGLSLCCMPYLGAEARFITNEVVVTPTEDMIDSSSTPINQSISLTMHRMYGISIPLLNNAGYRLCGITQDMQQDYTLKVETIEHLFEQIASYYDLTEITTDPGYSSIYLNNLGYVQEITLKSNTNLGIMFDMPIRLHEEGTFYRDMGNRVQVFDRPSVPYKKITYSCYPANNPQSEQAVQGELTLLLGNFTIPLPVYNTCTNQQKNQMVTLKPTNKNTLDKQGEILAGDFSLQLDCKVGYTGIAGVAAGMSNIYIQFTDQSNPSNNSDILTLTNHSSAKGVGLKIYSTKNNQAVQFSPVQTDKLKPIQSNASRYINSGINHLNYKVHYVKTGEITPGSVQGIATVAFYYP